MPDFPPGFESLGTTTPPDGDTVASQGYTHQLFEELLETAVAYADSAWEEEFTEDMLSRFKQWGTGMFLSDNQRDQLERIAGGEE